MGSSSLLLIAVVVGGGIIFKDQIIAFLEEQGIDLGDITGKKEEEETEEVVDDGLTPNQRLIEGYSQKVIAVDFYAGKIATAITRMSANNIFDATRIKEEIVDKFIHDVEKLAQLQGYKTEDVPATGAGIKIFAGVVLKTVNNLRIGMKQKDRVAVEMVAGIGAGAGSPPLTQQVIVNMYAYLAETFNNSPTLTDPSIKEAKEKAKK